MRRVQQISLLALFWLALSLSAKADLVPSDSIPPDSVVQSATRDKVVEEVVPNKKSKEAKSFQPNSTKAVLFSIIPGGGQVYNRVYWKLPIVIGAYTACYYAISWNNNNLLDYATAFRDIKSSTPMEHQSWKDFIPYGADPKSYVNNTGFHEQLRRGRDFYRRNRDLSIIITVGIYALFMIDAYIDAELYSFDISPNLTLSYAPAYIPSTPQTPDSGIGVQLALTF